MDAKKTSSQNGASKGIPALEDTSAISFVALSTLVGPSGSKPPPKRKTSAFKAPPSSKKAKGDEASS